MRLDGAVLADLTISFSPTAFVRATKLDFRATPLGMGYGKTRFASPSNAFKVLYVAHDLSTSLAETMIRDRFVGKLRRRLLSSEVESWGVVQVDATMPLRLVDIRTTGLLRLGVSTDAGRGRDQRWGRKLSQAVHDQSAADGILYGSRLTGGMCCAVYDRAVHRLVAGAVVEAFALASLVPTLADLGVDVVSPW